MHPFGQGQLKSCKVIFLPATYAVRGKVMFSVMSVLLFTGGGHVMVFGAEVRWLMVQWTMLGGGGGVRVRWSMGRGSAQVTCMP